MADTVRDLSALEIILDDNTAGDISPQDHRDELVSLQGSHGTYTAQGNAVATVIPDTTNYVEVAPAGALGEALRFDTPANGRLRYNGSLVLPTAAVLVTIALTFTTASANQDVFFRIGKSGTTDALSEQRVKKLVAADNVTVTLQLLTTVADLEYFSLFVRNTTSISNITVVNMSITAVTRLT